MAKIINKSIPPIKRNNLQLLKFNRNNIEYKLSNEKKSWKKNNSLFKLEPAVPHNDIYKGLDESSEDYKTETKNVFLTQVR